MKPFGLNKAHKLCSTIAIDALFMRDGDSKAALAYPLRIVWRVNDKRKADADTPKFLISVPRRKIRHAVDRVLLRRRIREAYRLNRPAILGDLSLHIDMAFVYIADKITDYKQINRAVVKILSKIAQQCSQDSSVQS